MVSLIEYNDAEGSKGFPLTQDGLYFSIFKYCNNEGVDVIITPDLVEDYFNKGSYQLQVDYELQQPLSKARLLELDENGKPLPNSLGTGKSMYIEEDPENIPTRCRGWFKLKNNTEGDEEFVTFPKSKAYNLINGVFMDKGLVPTGNRRPVSFDYDELEPLLMGYEFNLKVGEIKGSTGSYYIPLVNPVSSEPEMVF